MVNPIQTRIRADEYFQLPEYAQNDLIQLIEGEVIIAIPPIVKHQIVVGEILYYLMTYARKVGGRALTAPIELYLDEHNIYQPDVLYIKPGSACELAEKRLIGAPDLVVEVLSPSTAKQDRQAKYEAYQGHGVGEYWIVDPVHEVIEVWTLGAEGVFQRQGAYDSADAFSSATLGEDVPVKTIFGISPASPETPRPSIQQD